MNVSLATWLTEAARLPLWLDLVWKWTVLLALAWVVHHAIRRANPRWRVLLWRSLAIGILAMPLAVLGVPRIDISVIAPEKDRTVTDVAPLSAGATAAHASETTPRGTTRPSPPPPERASSARAKGSGLGGERSTLASESLETSAAPSPSAAGDAEVGPAEGMDARFWTSVAYGGVVVVLLLRLLAAHGRVRLLVRASRPVPEELVRRSREIAALLGCSRSFEVRAVDNLSTPLLTGLRRARVLLPTRMLEPPYRDELPAIVAHELAHLRARDLPWGYVIHLVSITLWFHPLVWRVHASHTAACEEVSDAISADLLGSVHRYSRLLARVAVEVTARPSLRGGVAMARFSDISRRVHSLRRRVFSEPLVRRRVLATLVGGTLGLGLLSALRLAVAEERDTLTFTGVVTTEADFPRAHVVFFPSDERQRRGSPESDESGLFTLRKVSPDKKHWIARAQAARTMAVFTLPGKPPGEPLRVRLDLDPIDVEGRVVDAAGHPVPGREVEVRLVTPEGHLIPLKGVETDGDGYFLAWSVPGADGYGVEVRPAGGDQDHPWSRTPLRRGQLTLEVPDLVARDVTPGEGQAPAPAKVPYSGRVLDEADDPIEGVEVRLSWSVIRGSFTMGASTSVRTDADGRWRRQMHRDPRDLAIRLYHREYVSGQYERQNRTPPIERLRDGSAVMVMRRGHVLRGVVHGDGGRPIPDALILTQPLISTTAGIGQPVEDSTMARTGKYGEFRISGIPAGSRDLVVYARGFAPQVVGLDVRSETPSVDIAMRAGGTVRGRVVDRDGRALAGVRATAGDWNLRGRRPLPRQVLTDDDGDFELRDLPFEGAFSVRLGKQGYMSTSYGELAPRDEPYELTLHEPTVIEGRVLDEETGEPVPAFDVIQGTRSVGLDGVVFNDRRKTPVESLDGTFTAKLDGWIASPPYPIFAVRVVAPGYLPGESPAVKVGERIAPVTLRLRRAAPFTGTVVDSRGRPVKEAQVAWVGPGRSAFVSDGKLDMRFLQVPEHIERTDEAGRFELPASEARGVIFALHERGYAIVESLKYSVGMRVPLVPWARVDGVLKEGQKGVFAATISLVPKDQLDPREGLDPVTWTLTAPTHTDGRFAVEHVPAIPLRIGMQATGMLSHPIDLTPEPGRTHRVELGGPGATVEGRIARPESLELSAFSEVFAIGRHFTRVVAYPVELADKPLQERPNFVAKLEEDGRFRVSSLPAGSYELSVEVHAPPQPQTCGIPISVAHAKTRFEIETEDFDTVIGVPTLTLTVTLGPQVGQSVPALAGKTLAGTSFDLKELRGKVVILDFWASWCAPCVAELPLIKRLHERYGKDDVAFVGVNLDFQEEEAAALIEEKGVSWPQLATGAWGNENPVLQAFGVSAVPSLWIIGGDGKVLARDLRGDELAGAIERVLKELR